MSGLGTNESNPLFRQSQSFASISNLAPSPETRPDSGSMSQLALPPARVYAQPPAREASPASSESHFSNKLERGPSDDPSSFTHSSRNAAYPVYPAYPSDSSYQDEAEQPILPPNFPNPSTVTSGGGQYLPPPMTGITGLYGAQNYAAEAEELRTDRSRIQQPHPSHGRGISLVDTGPVPVGGQQAPHDPVRRVSKHARRSSSRNQLVSPASTSSHSANLPPGAVSSFRFYITDKADISPGTAVLSLRRIRTVQLD